MDEPKKGPSLESSLEGERRKIARYVKESTLCATCTNGMVLVERMDPSGARMALKSWCRSVGRYDAPEDRGSIPGSDEEPDMIPQAFEVGGLIVFCDEYASREESKEG